MPQGQITGTRIRDQRLDRGISQTDLARTAGISASYLNLIEHNRRRIGGKLLHDIARALTLDPAVLVDVAAPSLLEALSLAAAEYPEAGAELPRTGDFAARFPGWAATVAGQARRIAELEQRVAALSDRLAHDPHLDRSLHEVISVVTSIRSTASILAAGEGLDPDWQDRFHQNLHSDSRRLAEASQALAAYLEAPRGSAASGLSAVEEVERFQAAFAGQMAALERGEGAQTAWAAAGRLSSPGVVALARGWLSDRQADARRLPMADVVRAVAVAGYDPGAVAAELEADLPLVMRRMAALQPGPEHPPMGLAVCDAAGALIELRPVAGFALPRSGAACPLWPLFQALTAPGQPVRTVVEMPGAAAQRLTCFAVAQAVGPVRFDAPPQVRASMLVVADAPTGPARPVGRTCRVCPRTRCPARREPSILPEQSAPGAVPDL